MSVETFPDLERLSKGDVPGPEVGRPLPGPGTDLQSPLLVLEGPHTRAGVREWTSLSRKETLPNGCSGTRNAKNLKAFMRT